MRENGMGRPNIQSKERADGSHGGRFDAGDPAQAHDLLQHQMHVSPLFLDLLMHDHCGIHRALWDFGSSFGELWGVGLKKELSTQASSLQKHELLAQHRPSFSAFSGIFTDDLCWSSHDAFLFKIFFMFRFFSIQFLS